ncbi:MAG: DUF177 domain-containing protein [Candidatus Methylacidiphilales bacterium]
MSHPLHIPVPQLVENEPYPLEVTVAATLPDLNLPEPDQWDPLICRFEALLTGKECLVTGTVRTRLTRPCDRCLEPLPVPFEIDSVHSYDCRNLRVIDLTPAVTEDILLSLPIAHRCVLDENSHCPVTGLLHSTAVQTTGSVNGGDLWNVLDKLEENKE